MSFATIASNAPTPQPIGNTYTLSGAALAANAPSTQSLSQGDTGAVLTKTQLLATRMDNLHIYGGGGMGIYWGLGLSAGAGLSLIVAQGQCQLLGLAEIAGQAVTLTASATNYIWAKYTVSGGVAGASIQVTTTTTPPTANSLCIGIVTTSSSAITGIDYGGIVYFKSGRMMRTTGDRSVPSDTLSAALIGLLTITQSGTWEWDGSKHRPNGNPVYTATLSGDLTLSTANPSTDFGVFALNPGGANRVVKLPSNPSLDQWITIINTASSGSNSITVKDPTGATTICTLSNAQSTSMIGPKPVGYPTGAITPI